MRLTKTLLYTLLILITTKPLTTHATQPSPPNIVFIFTDDHAYQAISAYKSRLASVAPTPNIDRIAAQGIRFEHAYVTNSICGPSRAVIQTGKHSHLNGFLKNGNHFNPNQQTFPKILQANGYQTAMVGKWHLHTIPQGFNYHLRLPGQGRYYNPDFINQEEKRIRIPGYVTDIITKKSLNWLKNSRDKTKPFMIMVQHKAPHREWLPEGKYLNLFDGEKIPEPTTLFDDYNTRGTPAHTQQMTIDKTMSLGKDLKVWEAYKKPFQTKIKNFLIGRMSPKQKQTWLAAYSPKNQDFLAQNLAGRDLVRWKYQRYMKDYLRCIRSVDDGVGEILDYLKDAGLDKNTVVIYCSDQGFYLGEHGWFDKRFMYKESFRTPLLIKYPNITKPNTVNTDLVQNLDFAQTFLDIACIKQPKDMQGRSLLPIIKGQTPKNWRKYLYYHYYGYPAIHDVRRHEGIANKRYKLMHFYDINEWEFYDLKNDADEVQNQINNPKHQTLIKQLKLELIKLKKQYKVVDQS